MGVFPAKKFQSTADAGKFAVRYRKLMAKHPFLLFGLPFMSVIVAGSFVLTPATAVRYEKHDRRVRQMTKEEALGVGSSRRKVNMKDEYYRLAAKDLDDWEQKRVKRLPGEHDGVL
ncbi:cytochrome c oxidase assembly protein COX16-domain-containing protein [Hypoxylon fragiforme]|uniref:cytochrome c oxidase assembly protein COX16-domain-containing protein n=1 Tax=Hypoxylon fragiforme TaxID=63214 RepID=UPI0020C715DA|nr:cytochrome c oxidase assembly protein COX16-domain-containing protein [Hypoxylon fragiforme]KAI2604748.1 cytochrome c oxidase assembly protein COX16-domain-containing protein [Hypoxylon fragiforme]